MHINSSIFFPVTAWGYYQLFDTISNITSIPTMEIFKQRSWIVLLALISVMLFKLTACVSSPDKPQLFIAAAASLTSPLTVISEEFTAKTGIPVTFTFASTANLAQQVRNGAPFDIFAAADPF